MGVAIAVVVASVVGITLAIVFAERARLLRWMRKQPRRAIGDAVDGEVVRLVGRVALTGAPLVAPLTGRPCAAWQVVVEEYRSNGKSGSWRKVGHAHDGTEFVLDDGTGRAVIEPRAARVEMVFDQTTKSGTFDDPTAIEEALLARLGLRGRGWLFNKSLRYQEGALEPGETIAVVGCVHREPDPHGGGGGYRTAPMRTRIGGAGERGLVITDELSVTR